MQSSWRILAAAGWAPVVAIKPKGQESGHGHDRQGRWHSARAFLHFLFSLLHFLLVT